MVNRPLNRRGRREGRGGKGGFSQKQTFTHNNRLGTIAALRLGGRLLAKHLLSSDFENGYEIDISVFDNSYCEIDFFLAAQNSLG